MLELLGKHFSDVLANSLLSRSSEKNISVVTATLQMMKWEARNCDKLADRRWTGRKSEEGSQEVHRNHVQYCRGESEA